MNAVFQTLKDHGIADNDTRRVVIDIRVGQIPMIYTERYDDESVIKVVEALSTVEIEYAKEQRSDEQR